MVQRGSSNSVLLIDAHFQYFLSEFKFKLRILKSQLINFFFFLVHALLQDWTVCSRFPLLASLHVLLFPLCPSSLACCAERTLGAVCVTSGASGCPLATGRRPEPSRPISCRRADLFAGALTLMGGEVCGW